MCVCVVYVCMRTEACNIPKNNFMSLVSILSRLSVWVRNLLTFVSDFKNLCCCNLMIV